MKWLLAVLLLTNMGLALWDYDRGPPLALTPHPVHPQLMQRVLAGAQSPPLTPHPSVIVPTGSASRRVSGAGAKRRVQGKEPGKPPHAPKASRSRKPLHRRTLSQLPPVMRHAATKTDCWQLGPVLGRARAVHLLHRLHVTGRVLSRLGPPAYRVFLPVGIPWPSAAVLAKAGVRGAYVAHGPTGAEVLSLGVFLKRPAAQALVRTLQSQHLPALIAPFGAPTHYYDQVRLPRVSAALWHTLGPIGHTVCAPPR